SEKCLCHTEPRHQFTSNATYGLAFAKDSRGFVKALVAGWQSNVIVTVRAGVPLNTPSGYIGTDGLGRSRSGLGAPTPGDRPSLAPGAAVSTSGTTAGCAGVAAGQKLGTPSLWFDPCAFVLPPAGTFGNLAKNAVIGPGLANVGFAMKKQFDFTELHK